MTRLIRLLVPSPDRRRVLARPNGLAGWSLPTVAGPATGPGLPEVTSTEWSDGLVAAAVAVLGGDVAAVRPVSDDTWEMAARGRLRVPGTTWIGADEVGRLGADAAIAMQFLATESDADQPADPGTHLGSAAG